MTRDEKIEALEGLSQYLLEEVQFSSHAHERKAFTEWRSVVEDIRQDLAIERMQEGVRLEGRTIGKVSVDVSQYRRETDTHD